MRKKLFAIVSMCFVFVFVLTGCLEIVGISTLKLETKVSPYGIWENYYEIENNYKNFVESLNKIEQHNIAYKTLINNIDNRERILSVLRNSVAVIDVFENNDSIALYDFADLENYQIVPDVELGNYIITYNEYLNRHKTAITNEAVDNLIYNLKMHVTVRVRVSKNDQDIYTLRLVETTEIPQMVETYYDEKFDKNGNVTITKLEFSGGATNPTFTASQEIKDATNKRVYFYSRKLEFQKLDTFNYLTSIVTFNDGSTETKTYKLGQTISPIMINYKPQVGYFSYEFSYKEQGSMNVFGESYYQGKNKYLIKEDFELNQGKPYNFSESYSMELDLNGKASKLKFVLGQTNKQSTIKDKNLLTFATYTNEKRAIAIMTVAEKPVLEGYLE